MTGRTLGIILLAAFMLELGSFAFAAPWPLVGFVVALGLAWAATTYWWVKDTARRVEQGDGQQ